MRYTFQFSTDAERAQLESDNADKFLREVQCLGGGNYLIFDDEPSATEQLQSENADLKSRVSDMELAVADLLAGGGV